MPDPTAEDLRRRYQDRLQKELAELQASSAQSAEARGTVVLDQQSLGRLSRMDALQGQAMAAAVEARRQGRQRAIEAALERLAGEDYGWCEDCGEFIGLNRLDLDPALQRCVSCAS